jgi:hypothetical protein
MQLAPYARLIDLTDILRAHFDSELHRPHWGRRMRFPINGEIRV